MRKLFATFAVFLLMVLSLTDRPSLAQDAEATLQYVYTFQAEEGQFSIGAIDSRDFTTAAIISLPVAANWNLADARSNAENDWIAFVFRTSLGYTIRLYRLSTGETRDIIQDVLLSPGPTNLMAPQQEFTWSPNGAYLAFNTFQVINQRAVFDTYLYSLDDNRLFRLTDDPAQQSQLAWSADSQRLAIATVDCQQECRATIALFDGGSHARTTAFDITASAVGANTDGGVCHLDWSPDGRYISFMANCDGSLYALYKEMYLLDTTVGTTARLTSFTYEQEPNEPLGSVFANYEPVWYNENTLLISAVFGNQGTLQAQTFAYDAATSTTTVLSAEFVTSWTVNPLSREIAFQSLQDISLDGYDNRYIPSSVEFTSDGATNTRIPTAEVFSGAIATAPGCILSWSPDGSVLASSIPENNNCRFLASRYPPERFRFTSGLDGTSIEYTPDVGGADPYIFIPIGWIAP